MRFKVNEVHNRCFDMICNCCKCQSFPLSILWLFLDILINHLVYKMSDKSAFQNILKSRVTSIFSNQHTKSNPKQTFQELNFKQRNGLNLLNYYHNCHWSISVNQLINLLIYHFSLVITFDWNHCICAGNVNVKHNRCQSKQHWWGGVTVNLCLRQWSSRPRRWPSAAGAHSSTSSYTMRRDVRLGSSG